MLTLSINIIDHYLYQYYIYEIERYNANSESYIKLLRQLNFIKLILKFDMELRKLEKLQYMHMYYVYEL